MELTESQWVQRHESAHMTSPEAQRKWGRACQEEMSTRKSPLPGVVSLGAANEDRGPTEGTEPHTCQCHHHKDKQCQQLVGRGERGPSMHCW